MEQLPTWLEAAISAAGMATVYNADHWGRLQDVEAANDATDDFPEIHHHKPH